MSVTCLLLPGFCGLSLVSTSAVRRHKRKCGRAGNTLTGGTGRWCRGGEVALVRSVGREVEGKHTQERLRGPSCTGPLCPGAVRWSCDERVMLTLCMCVHGCPLYTDSQCALTQRDHTTQGVAWSRRRKSIK